MIRPAVFIFAPSTPQSFSFSLFIDGVVCAILAVEMATSNEIAVGATAPDFSLPDSTGQQRRLSELVEDSPLVLVFYRGHW